MYFVSATDNGLVMSTEKLVKMTKTIKGVTYDVPVQADVNVKFAFVAWPNAKELGLQRGEQLQFHPSEKKVFSKKENKELDLFWANPDAEKK